MNDRMNEAQRQTLFSCAAMKQGTAGGNDPAECDWPVCGCDPYANRVIETLFESGWTSGAPEKTRIEWISSGPGESFVVAVTDKSGSNILRVRMDGDIEVDWTKVREHARRAHDQMRSGEYSCDLVLGICAVAWAAANPGVKP